MNHVSPVSCARFMIPARPGGWGFASIFYNFFAYFFPQRTDARSLFFHKYMEYTEAYKKTQSFASWGRRERAETFLLLDTERVQSVRFYVRHELCSHTNHRLLMTVCKQRWLVKCVESPTIKECFIGAIKTSPSAAAASALRCFLPKIRLAVLQTFIIVVTLKSRLWIPVEGPPKNYRFRRRWAEACRPGSKQLRVRF